jgi:addiction module HigA family antidote
MEHNEEYISVRPSHPGTLLLTEYLRPLGITPHALAVRMHVPATRIDNLVKGKRAITADTAMRLGRFFGTSAQFWMNLQAYYDLAIAEDANAERIGREVQPLDFLAAV